MPDDTDLFRPVCTRQRRRNTVKKSHIREALALAPPLFDIPICRPAFAKVLTRNLAPQHRQLLRGPIRKRPEQNGIQHAEHCGIGANRQRQCGYGGRRKTGALAESPHGVAYVLRHRFDQGKRPSFTVPFLHRFYASKAAQCGIACLSRIHAGFEVVLDLHLQVKADLIIQLALQSFVSEQATQPSCNHTSPAHRIVDDIRLQSSVSLASRLRPAAVME